VFGVALRAQAGAKLDKPVARTTETCEVWLSTLVQAGSNGQ
jgi:hypothetical protein